MAIGFNDEYHYNKIVIIIFIECSKPIVFSSMPVKGKATAHTYLTITMPMGSPAASLDLLMEAWGNPLTSQWRYGAWETALSDLMHSF